MDQDPVAEARRCYDAQTTALVGRRLLGLNYWDVHNFSDEPRHWDYGDWHHAVMGVEFETDDGLFSLLWTDAFFLYGVEVFHQPIAEHLALGPEGPEGWAAGDSPEWRRRVGGVIRNATTFWEQIEMGPGHTSDGTQVSDGVVHHVPVALRLDLDPGPVWMVAGIPQWPEVEEVFVPGDEIVVAFSQDRMRKIGFADSSFLDPADD